MLSIYMVREIVARHRRSQSLRGIARELGVDRRTVRRWVRIGRWQPREQRDRSPGLCPSLVEQTGEKVLWNARALYRALSSAGFACTYVQI